MMKNKYIFFAACAAASLVSANGNSITVQNYINDLNFIVTVLNGGEMKKTVHATHPGEFSTVIFEGLGNGAHTITIEREPRALDSLRHMAAYLHAFVATPQQQRIMVKDAGNGVLEECREKLIWSASLNNGTHVVIQLQNAPTERKIVASLLYNREHVGEPVNTESTQ